MKKVMSSIVSLFLGLTLLNQPLAAAEEVDLSKLFGGKSEFLDVDQAFKLNTEIVDQEIIVKFEIADEYYLYRSRFYFDAKGATLSDAYIPDGKRRSMNILVMSRFITITWKSAFHLSPIKKSLPLLSNIRAVQKQGFVIRRKKRNFRC